MSVRSRLRTPGAIARGPAPPVAARTGPPGPPEPEPDARNPVFLVQRAGALIVGAFLLVFGVLGFAGGLDFFSTEGERVLGMSSNGLLSALSVVVGLVLLAADVRGPRPASTLMIVIGALFLTSALVNLALLRTPFNVLAFEMSNVLFSIGVGLVLLVLGAYGRVSGNLPADSPYAHPHPSGPEEAPESYPSTPEEFAAEDAMREAELAVTEHRATDDQRRRVRAMAAVHTRGDRRRVWMEFDPPPPPPPSSPAASGRWADRAAAVARGRRQGQERLRGK